MSAAYVLWSTDPAHPERERFAVAKGSRGHCQREMRFQLDAIKGGGGAMPYPFREFTIERS